MALTEKQQITLQRLCAGYKVEYRETDYLPAFDLPTGWVSGWIGGNNHGFQGPHKRTIYVGVSPEGEAHS